MATKKESGGKEGQAKRVDGIHKPVKPSDQLAAVVGAEPIPRSEVISRVWTYIKDNKLQDAKDGRQINADDKLKPIFGKDQISMFEMNKRISEHLSNA
ncbi:MAG TPA: SWIB/MDM2 domain-containing protein [Mesorhizobium sp.]|jgi:chromatin remodeling complex protein RSC6|nr:SWIB/MDM2 domain-containing protein [Mesorhizobium sp.]